MNLPTSLDFKMTSSESGFKPNLPTSLTFEMALFGFGAPYCTAFVTFYLPSYLPPIFDVSNFFFVWKRYTKTTSSKEKKSGQMSLVGMISSSQCSLTDPSTHTPSLFSVQLPVD